MANETVPILYTIIYESCKHIYYNSYVTLPTQIVKMYVIKKILTKLIIQLTNVSMLTSPLVGSLLHIVAVYVHVCISNEMR